jgi:hypothetical protein
MLSYLATIQGKCNAIAFIDCSVLSPWQLLCMSFISFQHSKVEPNEQHFSNACAFYIAGSGANQAFLLPSISIHQY